MGDVVRMGEGVYDKVSEPVLDAGWEEKARNIALHFCVFERDIDSPMADASLAKIFYQHIPSAVKLDAEGAEPREGFARDLSRSIERDMVVGRDFDNWLAGYNHLPEGTRAIFAKGKDNALNPVLDRLADIGQFERSDILVREAKAQDQGLLVKNERNFANRSAAMAALGMDGPGR